MTLLLANWVNDFTVELGASEKVFLLGYERKEIAEWSSRRVELQE